MEAQARKCIVEHPFGTMKRAFNQGYFAAEGIRQTCWRGRIHRAGLQHEKSFEHSWTRTHAGFLILVVEERK